MAELTERHGVVCLVTDFLIDNGGDIGKAQASMLKTAARIARVTAERIEDDGYQAELDDNGLPAATERTCSEMRDLVDAWARLEKVRRRRGKQ